jgi:chemotaxis protein methyltransferase CheR
MPEITSIEFNLLKKYLREVSGIDVPDEKRYLFTTRLAEFLEEKKLSGFSELYTRLTTGKSSELQREFVQCMTTHESSFFRDVRPFTLLTERLLPELAARRIAEAKYLPPRIRILSAGCSLGQEPYSIAMCVAEWLSTQERLVKDDVTIVAADISQKVLCRAALGRYTDMEIGRSIPQQMRVRYVKKVNADVFEVAEVIRSMVRFCEHNLSKPFTGMGKFDLIFCRNVIIYFPLDLKKKILHQFSRQLNADGCLIMGSSETIYNLSDDFAIKQHDGMSCYVPLKRVEP